MTAISLYSVRWRWLRIMYVYTIVIGGLFGLGELVAPARMQSLLGMPGQDPVVFGLAASVFLAMALAAILGLRAPLKYCPILLVEVVYKVVWLCFVVLPLAVKGCFPAYATVQVVIFVTFIIGDLIAIPFRYVFGRDAAPPSARVDVVDYH
jgi:hypothetical protein